MKLNLTEQSIINSLASNLCVPDRESVYLRSVYKTTWNAPPHNKRWTCACASELCTLTSGRSSSAASRLPLFLIGVGVTSSARSLLSDSSDCAGQRGRDREGERASERGSSLWPPGLNAETMATRLGVTAGDRNMHKHRNRPFCQWDGPTVAWESRGGTVSLSLAPSLPFPFSICPNMTKSDALADCILLAGGPKGRSSERHGVVGKERGIF